MEIDFDKTSSDHYLKISKTKNLKYFEEFLEALELMKPYLTKKKLKDLLKNKLLLERDKFDKNTFIQHAVEMSVLRFFAEEFGETFQYEKKVNPNNKTDVDCWIVDGDFKYNIEVKTPVLDKKSQNILPGMKGRSLGRLRSNQFEDIPKIFDRLKGVKEGSSKIFNFDNKLKQFLVDANKKFNPESFDSETEANVLILGLDDAYEIINWVHYLIGNSGLFTSNSFCNPDEYKLVDFVVFTNMYFKHSNATTDKCLDHWNSKHSFSVMYNNPMGNPIKQNILEHFLKLFPNYSIEAGNYLVQRSELKIAKNAFRLKFFIEDELEKNRGIYLFKKQSIS